MDGPAPPHDAVTLFLGGDLMTGRGVDQILPHPSRPALREPHIRDARAYVALAESVSGPIPRGVAPEYIWGDALEELDRMAPAARIVNLETSVTRCEDYWPGKRIHYRMHPANVACLRAAGLDVCVLANNHVLDFGRPGLEETLDTLAAAGLRTAGAGRNLAEARRPAAIDLAGGGRVLVFGVGLESSGIPPAWAAGPDRPGVDFLAAPSDAAADEIVERAARERRPGDIVVVSIHWNGNWGYGVPRAHVRFAHRLIEGGVDLIHGHSSHHPRPIEVYRGRLVLYGSGDLLDDYEGITGYEEFRGDLVLLYFPTLDRAGRLLRLRMSPVRIHRMRLNRASLEEAEWLRDTLERVSGEFGAAVALADGRLVLR